jgi:two-component system sensor histidine kinase TctE
MSERRSTLRGKLLRWLLIPMSLLFLLDAAGSYVLATRLADRVYDGELMEIARELVLHVKRDGTKIAFDLEADAERTLLLDQYDKVYYTVRAAEGRCIAGDADLSARITRVRAPRSTTAQSAAPGSASRSSARSEPDAQGPAVVVQVAETLTKRGR